MKICFINDGMDTFAVFDKRADNLLLGRGTRGQTRKFSLGYLRSRIGQNDDAPAVDVSRLTAEIARETNEPLEPLSLCQFLDFVSASTKTRQYAVVVHIRAISADEATERVGMALFGRGYTWEIAPTETKQE